MLKPLTELAIRQTGNVYRNQRTGKTIKGMAPAKDSNMLQVCLSEDVQLGDILILNRGLHATQLNYFVTDQQQDVASKYLSIFMITHQLVNQDSAEQVPAHLGQATTPSSERSAAGFNDPQEFIFWIPNRYAVAVGQTYQDSTGTTFRVSQVVRTNNNGFQVTMNA